MQDAKDLDRQQSNLELALPHQVDAARIYRAIGRMENADTCARNVLNMEENLRRIAMYRAATAAAADAASTKG